MLLLSSINPSDATSAPTSTFSCIPMLSQMYFSGLSKEICPLSPFHRRSAITGHPHSLNTSYRSPTVIQRCLAIKARAASNGFRVRLSRKRISGGVKPRASATTFHSSPPVTKKNINVYIRQHFADARLWAVYL